MQQIFPSLVDDVDPLTLLASEERRPHASRPWVMSNMISTIDGAIAVNGVSGGLGGPGDKQVFSAIRALADIIVVASGTAIAENYQKPQTPQSVQDMRVGRGQAPLPRIALVTGSLSIDPTHRVFDPDARPIVVTHAAAPPDRRSALSEVADIMVAGDTQVVLTDALSQFAEAGAACVLVEGGPTLNGAFAQDDLIDEWSLSSSPLIVGGSGGRAVVSRDSFEPRMFRLDRTLHEEGFLFHRYLRERT